MRYEVKLTALPRAETLRYLGWGDAPVDEQTAAQIARAEREILESIEPSVIIRRFQIGRNGRFEGTAFRPEGGDMNALLHGCDQAALFAATLGAGSERLLLRCQAVDPAQALVLDAALTACIEWVCDAAQGKFEQELREQERYATERFSPGYGDMPIWQTREICQVLSADRSIGLTVSASGLMIPRKSVTAIIGVSRSPQLKQKSRCARCAMRSACALRRNAMNGCVCKEG